VIRRREFIAGLGLAAIPIIGSAQPIARPPTIGFMGGTTAVLSAAYIGAFVQRLRELGWIEGHNVAIEYRWAEGNDDRYKAIAAEFVGLKVDLMVVTGNTAALIAKQATSVIPIVFAVAGDPIGTGLVASLARPGGNVTGLSNQLIDAAAKRLGLLREVVPNLRRVALMANAASPLTALEIGEVNAAAGALGLEFVPIEIRRASDIAPALDGLKRRADALYVANDGLFAANRLRVATLALVAQLPTMFASREWLDVGGLMSYGANFSARFRRSADLVDKILRGTKPADIPVEQPTKLDLAVNLITANALGLTIPETLLATADEVIQ
jgi:putative tryptophan/tyrosine transport system substrate-binding protein